MKKTFYSLVIASLLSQAFAQTTVVGSWTVVKKVDQMTDANTSLAYSDGIEDTDATLFLACKPEGLRIYYSPDAYLDSDGNNMWWRFDKNPMFGAFKYSPSVKGTAAFIPSGSLTDKFLNEAKEAGQVVLRASKYNGDQLTYSFKVSGIADAVEMMNCK